MSRSQAARKQTNCKHGGAGTMGEPISDRRHTQMKHAGSVPQQTAAFGGFPYGLKSVVRMDDLRRLLRAVKPISRSQWNDGFGADSGLT
jgi:hypothetical protein